MQTKLFCTCEIIQVVRNNEFASCCYSKFQHHVIFGISQEWSPQKVNSMMARNASYVAQEFLHLLVCNTMRFNIPAQQYILIFCI